jgi:putative NIF3 family GTP cyclohydrolase 1 type 2
MNVHGIIQAVLSAVPGPVPSATVDTLKCGDPEAEVTRVITTFMATAQVIERAVALGAQMIVTHEPTFYNHLDDPTWAGLDHDHVLRAKRAVLDRNHLAVFRFHDAPHRMRPDAILAGVLDALGWSSAVSPACPRIIALEATPARAIIAHAVAGLGGTRPALVVGDSERVCRRIGVLVGASGGESHLRFLRDQKPDLLLCGELNEWETSEYVRDAIQLGFPMTLAVLGHATTEEAGMRWLAEWMRPLLPGVEVVHVPAGDPLRAI